MSAEGAPRIHVVDFEGNSRIGVIETGVLSLCDGCVEVARTRFCRPSGAIPPAESRVHRISDAMVVDAKPFADDYQDFVALRRSGIFAAHNATVESNLLRGQWPAPPMVPDWTRPGDTCADWGPWIDTLKVYRRLYPQLQDHSLQALLQTFRLQSRLDEWAGMYCPQSRRCPHAALYDALASALLLCHLWEAQIVAPNAWMQLLEWSGHRSAQGWF